VVTRRWYLWHALRAKCAPHRLDGWCRGRWNHQSRRCSTREGWTWPTMVIWKKCAFTNRYFPCTARAQPKSIGEPTIRCSRRASKSRSGN
jgi:hypothetical protein